jgi:hypothetical protein
MKYPFPFPKKDEFSGPRIYESSQDHYPFPVPETELYPEYPWPKSLCQHAPECPVTDDFADLSPIKECIHAYQEGCPIFLTQFSEFQSFGECNGVQIFEIGQAESKSYSQEDITKIIENFTKLKDSHRPPMVVLGHGEKQNMLQESGLPSAGWVSKIWAKGRKLFADFKDVPKQIVDIIQKGAYRYPSVEIYRNFVHNNQEFGPVLRRVALLGADIPRIKSLSDILARYGEDNCEGSFCLPVVRPDNFEETFWLGGDTMDKITVPIKSISGDFKVGEEVTGNKSNVIGKLEEFDDKKLVIMTSKGENFQDDEEITGKESEAKAVVGEPFAGKTIVLEMNAVEGTFKEGEKVSGKDSEITGTIRKVEPEKISVFLAVEGNFKEGEEIIGADSEAKAKVGKKPSPYKYPKPPVKDAEGLKQLQEQMEAMQDQLNEKDTEITNLKTQALTQDEKISEIEKKGLAERRASHLKDVENWCESLKTKGLAPAIIDELGLRNYASALDWQKTFKFAEGEDSQTPWNKFKVVFDGIIDRHAEGKLFVPLDKLGQVVEEGDIIASGIDEEGAKLDREITKHAEDNEVSYDEAFKAVMSEKEK